MTQAMTGARAIFKINDTIVAIAQNCTYTETDNLQPVEVLGRENAAEHAELGRTVEFTVDTVRVAAKSASKMGLSTRLQDLLVQPELTASIEDKVSSTTVLDIIGVKKQNRSGTLNARGLFTESISFVGRVLSDDSDTQEVATGTPAYPFSE